MSFVGIVGMISQAGLVGYLTARYSEYALTLSCVGGLAFSFGLYAFVEDVVSLYLLCIPLVFFNTLLNLVNSSQIARAAPQDLKGTLVALDMVGLPQHSLPC